MINNNKEEARRFLQSLGVFYGDMEGDEDPKLNQTLNMNDTWGWATAFGEYVPDEDLVEVARLFWYYGWAGLLYWVSERNEKMRSEFHDVNRMVDFVRSEEEIGREIPDYYKRAYTHRTYTIG